MLALLIALVQFVPVDLDAEIPQEEGELMSSHLVHTVMDAVEVLVGHYGLSTIKHKYHLERILHQPWCLRLQYQLSS